MIATQKTRKECQQYAGKAESPDIFQRENPNKVYMRVFNGEQLPNPDETIKLLAEKYSKPTLKEKISNIWETYRDPILGFALATGMAVGMAYVAKKSAEISNENYRPSIERSVGE